MSQLYLPGSVKPTFWQKTKMTLSALFQPQVYMGLKNAETQSRNTALTIASNQAIEESRQNLRLKELQLQYVQFKEREANLAEMENLRRELQENEGRENRYLQERLAKLNREFQANEGEKNREIQIGVAEFRAKVDMAIQEKNQKFQTEQADINRKFQAIMASANHERQKELTEFRAKVDMAMQEKNFDFQRWSLEQQRELQLQLKTIDAELSRELRAYDRETSMKLIEEKKKSDNSPLWLVAGQIIGSNQGDMPLPLRIFLSPPVLPYDRIARPSEGVKGFPEMADWLAEDLRQFFGNYSANGRKTDFLYGAMVSKFFHGEAATLSLFDTFKTEPTLILESSVEGDYFNIRLGYWGVNYGKYRYQSLISGLSWREALNDFARVRAFNWYKRKEEWRASGKNPEDFDGMYGAENVKRFMNNLKIIEREQQCLEFGADINEIERPYSLHKQDYEDLKQFIASCHRLAAGLLTDEYFLADVPPANRRPPLFPELLTEVLKNIPEHEVGGLIDIVVSYYRNIYEYLNQSESCWIPEIALDLAKGLTVLPDKKWAKEQVTYSLQKWSELRGLQIPALLGFEYPVGMLSSAESVLTVSDVAYVEKLNLCLEGIGEKQRLNVADACFKRGMSRCKDEDYESAVKDFDQTIQLSPKRADAYYNRGLAYVRLNQYQKAVEDYTQVLNSDLQEFQNLKGVAYNNRANAYYRLGEHQKAIDDYTQALNIRPDWTEADKNRAIVQGVLDEINRKKQEEKERLKREEEERIRREEEQKRKRKEEERRKREEEQRRQREEEERRKREEEEKGKEFSFETVSVDSRGKIVSRRTCTAKQKTEDLGRGVKLGMVYIPGGTFMMGSPSGEANRSSDEGPQHKVTISPFYMGKYQVTQAQWEAVTGNNPSSFKGANRPVESVSWEDAAEFCKNLSKKTGKTYRLPTEAEWEYACRAGTTTPFYFGETITPDIVNYDGNYPYGSASKGTYRQQTTDVGNFSPNPFGLYDMHGNVWEWCLDIYASDIYNRHQKTDPIYTDSGDYRVVRGGSWYSNAQYCRSADRYGNTPAYRYTSIGFRFVRTL